MRRNNEIGTHEKGRIEKDNGKGSNGNGNGKGLRGNETSAYHPKLESLLIYPTTSQSPKRQRRNSPIPDSNRRIPARIRSTAAVTLEPTIQGRDAALRLPRRRITTGETTTRWMLTLERLPQVSLGSQSGNGSALLGIEENPMGQHPALAVAGMVRLNSWHHSNSSIPRRLNKIHNNHRRLLHPP